MRNYATIEAAATSLFPLFFNTGQLITTTHAPPHRAVFAEIDRIYEGIQPPLDADRRLPAEEWTHGAHLVAGTALLDAVGGDADQAAAIMPDWIRAYNEACGVENSETGGYHHTITLFYLGAIADFLKDRQPQRGETVVDRVNAVLAAPLADRGYILNFYHQAKLFSPQARANYLPPTRSAVDATTVTKSRL